jgi:hypothetical protein
MMIDHSDNVIDLNAILHPGSVYDHPRDVVADNTLSIGEKRAILASWASDTAAVACNPACAKFPARIGWSPLTKFSRRSPHSTTHPKGRRAANPRECGQHRELRWPCELRAGRHFAGRRCQRGLDEAEGRCSRADRGEAACAAICCFLYKLGLATTHARAR